MHLVNAKDRHRVLLLSGIAALFAAISSTTSLGNASIYDSALPSELLLGTLGFDVMSLVVSLALFGCLLALERGHDRYWLPWIGLQAICSMPMPSSHSGSSTHRCISSTSRS